MPPASAADQHPHSTSHQLSYPTRLRSCTLHPALQQYLPQPTASLSPQEYKIHNCELLFKEDISVDDLIDIIEGNRRYIKCLYVYNKVRVGR